MALVINKNGGFIPGGFYIFSPRAVGDEAVETFYLTRGPGTSMTMPTVRLTGTNTDVFTLVSDACTGSYLVPGMQCELQVKFEPVVAGNAFSAIIEASDDLGNKTTFAVSGRTP